MAETEPMPRYGGVTSDAEQAVLNLSLAEKKLTAAQATGDATAIAAAQTAVDSARKTADANPATVEQRAHAAWVEKYGSWQYLAANQPVDPNAKTPHPVMDNTAGMSVQTPGPWAGRAGSTSAPAARIFPEWWTSGRSSAPTTTTTTAPSSPPPAPAVPTSAEAEQAEQGKGRIASSVGGDGFLAEFARQLDALDGETVTITLSDERLRDLARRLRDADSDYRRRNGRL
jgi:hypothetical protein